MEEAARRNPFVDDRLPERLQRRLAESGGSMRFAEGDADRLLAHWTPLLQGALDALEKAKRRGTAARVRTAIRFHAQYELDGLASQARIEDLAALVGMLLRDVTRSVRAADCWADLPHGDWLQTLRLAGWWGDYAGDRGHFKDSDDWEAAGFMGRFYDILDFMHDVGEHLTVSEWLDAVERGRRLAAG